VLGFHGCDEEVGQKILHGSESHLRPSEQKYDWLGHGIYFWEGNPGRAMAWASQRKRDGKIDEPFVLGAIIDLRRCLDLFDRDCVAQVKEAHQKLTRSLHKVNLPPPRNVGKTPDRAGRTLDCAVINALHQYRKERREPGYDSVRGPFLEGEPIYPDAGFRCENHIQLCVRNYGCIKGYFRPLLDAVS
jgi:hypothetical protein